MNLLLDTNVVLYFLGGVEKVVNLLAKAEQLAVSFISEIELLSYTLEPEEAEAIQKFIENIEVLYPDAETVKRTIELRRSKHFKIPDALIVAQAQQNRLTLATADKELVKKMQGLDIIDPMAFK